MTQFTYYYLVMAQKDFLENQCLEEIFRERTTYFLSRKKPRNFWLTFSPDFLFDVSFFQKLKKTQFYKQKKDLFSTTLFNNTFQSNFFVSVVSSEKEFIDWLQLRLGYFENLSVSSSNSDSTFVSDGITGFFSSNSSVNPLKGSFDYLHPDILLQRNAKFLEFYYKTFQQNQLKI